VGVTPGAAGGPKGLILGALDRFIFGDWLAWSAHEVQRVGAAIGAWRMATACLDDPMTAFQRLEHDYVHPHYAVQPGLERVVFSAPQNGVPDYRSRQLTLRAVPAVAGAPSGACWDGGITGYHLHLDFSTPRCGWRRTRTGSRPCRVAKKLPDRTDFTHYGHDLAGRVKAWRSAIAASQQTGECVAGLAAAMSQRRSGFAPPLKRPCTAINSL
jgi:hypothetical protein